MDDTNNMETIITLDNLTPELNQKIQQLADGKYMRAGSMSCHSQSLQLWSGGGMTHDDNPTWHSDSHRMIHLDAGTQWAEIVAAIEMGAEEYRPAEILTRDLIVWHTDEETCRKIQEAAIASGYSWTGTERTVQNIQSCVASGMVFVMSGKSICYNPDPVSDRISLSAITDLPRILELLGGPRRPRSSMPTSDEPAAMTIEDILSDQLLGLVRSSPQLPELRGLIRAHTNAVIPREIVAAGSESIIGWLLENIKQPIVKNPATQNRREPAAPAATNGQIYEVPFTVEATLSGTCRFSETRTYSGRIRIPARALADCDTREELGTAIYEYVTDNYENFDSELTNIDYDNQETDRTEIQDHNIRSNDAITAYMADHPNQIAVEDEDE